jgi:hypothetical protein
MEVPMFAFGLCAIGTTLLSACSNGVTKSSNGSANPTFTMAEFTIKLAQPTLPSGRVTISAVNVGGEAHELVLVKASSVSDLPTKADGSVDEEKIPDAAKIGEIEDVLSKQAKSADFELAPGNYVAFCNLIDEMDAGPMMGADSSPMTSGAGGHVHFARGMHQLITVK